jgi:glycosyltransferase involved in cell wall biosynthesis
MNLSILIPAYNEEKYLPATLDALKAALADIADAEIIVVDNGSTDATREIAASFGVKIVTEHEHNIGRVRNTGAESATGDVIVFVDADTLVAPGLFENIVEAMSDKRCLGGSVAVEYETPNKRAWMRYFVMLFQFLGGLAKMRQGAAQFCRSEVFRELGGYDETIYVGEDVEFQWRLDKVARTRGSTTVFIEEPTVRTSSRRLEKMGLARMLFFTHPVTIFLAWRIRSFWKDWYENAIR